MQAKNTTQPDRKQQGWTLTLHNADMNDSVCFNASHTLWSIANSLQTILKCTYFLYIDLLYTQKMCQYTKSAWVRTWMRHVQNHDGQTGSLISIVVMCEHCNHGRSRHLTHVIAYWTVLFTLGLMHSSGSDSIGSGHIQLPRMVERKRLLLW